MSTPTQYECSLARELTAVGITGRARRRIVAEFADHLECDPGAALGDPRDIARQFADVVGSSRAKTSALAAFASLVVAGLLFAVAFVGAPGGMLRTVQRAGSRVPFMAPPASASVAAAVITIAVQIALAAGCLAILRWWWRRDTAVLPAAEARVIVRRAAVGVVAGIVAMLGLATCVIGARPELGARWSDLGVVLAGVGTAALLAAVPTLRAATRVRPLADGPAGDLSDDLGPFMPESLRGRPWRCAVWIAAAVALLITVAAVPAADVFDGAARGILDAVLCLTAFALLGPYLGLWSPGRLRSARR